MTPRRHRQIDQALWAAHLADDRRVVFEFRPGEWEAYAAKLSDEARGYWHGLTGRIAKRLGIADDSPEWKTYVQKSRKRWGPPEAIGDTSLEEVFLIAKASGLSRPGSTYHANPDAS